ncbi:hypothetical protein MBLNU13_g08579t1 [Cladosporium sp. NU13]
MANTKNNPAVESDLYKAFFDDATLSDLTIQLRDGTVRVHRIILCRKSEYFTKLLTGSFQENGRKEIELKEDDGNSMVAVLRYIYGLPYYERFGDQSDQLQPHAEAYVVAEKYQVEGLKLAISKKLRHMIHSERDLRKEGTEEADNERAEFIDALKIIVAGTPAHDNNHGRKVMVEACVLNLRLLHHMPEFLSLLRESSDLGADIIGHQDLECGLPGDWI